MTTKSHINILSKLDFHKNKNKRTIGDDQFIRGRKKVERPLVAGNSTPMGRAGLLVAVTAFALPLLGQAQLLESLVPTYFDDRPEDCTGPNDCTDAVKMRLTKHIRESDVYWGGFLGDSDVEDEYYSCLHSNANMCLIWEANEFQRYSTRRNWELETGLCECVLAGSKCTLHTDEAGDPAPGNLTLYNNGACDVSNYNADCGWDGGDCEGVPLGDGTYGDNSTKLDYSLPTIGSDNYCAVWTCEQQETGTSTYCSSYYYYYSWRDRARGRRLAESDDPMDRRSLRCSSRRSSHQETAECACTEESSNGNYCAKWYCEEYSGFGADVDGWDFYGYNYYYYNYNGPELEWYECTQEGNNGLYCAGWKSVVTTDPSYANGELELASCSCTSTTNEVASSNYPDGDNLIAADGSEYSIDPAFEGHCIRWQCEEDGWSYWTPSWVTFGVILFFLLVGLAFVGTASSKHKRCNKKPTFFSIVVTLVALAFLFVGWWSAGYIGGPIYLFIFIVWYVVAVVSKFQAHAYCDAVLCLFSVPPSVNSCAFILARRGAFKCECARPEPERRNTPPAAERYSPRDEV